MSARHCECGCGDAVSPSRRFVRGHHNRVRAISSKTRALISESNRRRCANDLPATRTCFICDEESPYEEFRWAGSIRRHHRKCEPVRYQMSRYGLTLEEAKLALTDQPCEICGKPAQATDHDHGTGKVRGRLCDNCNVGLGNFQDDVELLANAMNYLMKHTDIIGKIEESNVILF